MLIVAKGVKAWPKMEASGERKERLDILGSYKN
jgi:hypothetical protein